MTIDPIVKEDTKELKAEPGCVVVVKGKNGYRAFIDGKGPTFGERMFGGIEKYYLVNIGRREISDTFEAPSNKGALPFKLTVKYTVALEKAKAGEVVQEGLRDLTTIFADELKRQLRAKARSCDVLDINAARDALDTTLFEFKTDEKRFSFRAGIVEVALDDEIARKVREIQSAQIDKNRNAAVADVADQEIKWQQGLLRDGEKLMAAYQATGEQKYLDAFKLKLAETEKSRGEKLALLNKLLEKDYVEQMQLPEDVIKDLVSSVTQNLGMHSEPARPALETPATSKPSDPNIIEGEVTEVPKPPEG